MITLFVLLIAVCLIGFIVLCVAGLLAVAWPLAVILAIGLLVDCLILKKLILKK